MPEIDHTANPFPGLRPFESSETHLFFGRDGQSEELLRRLRRTRFLTVVGTSGSGKSSLVRAGMLPALQGGLMASAGSDWRIAILRPGGDPIGNLARALAAPAVLGARDEKDDSMAAVLAETTLRRSSLGLVELVSRARTKLDDAGKPHFPDYENLLVVVDQFEELFRFKQLIETENSKEDAAAFVKLLLEAVGDKNEKKIYVVLTMRSDFLGDCSQFFELPEAINNGQYLIPRMTRDERREAISGPVAVGQGAISEPLVNQLLNDVGDNPDQLPIMQHALMRTWDHWQSHRNGNPLDIPDYIAIGGMAEALSRHADEAYAELSDSQQLIAEKLFKGLTEKGTDNREIRRPMEVGEICELTGADDAAVIAVIEVFRREGRSFLMPPPTDALSGAPVHLNRESLIDISHESLIRNWERLKTWVDEESRSARIYRRLAETAVLHKEGGAGLWRDPDLGVALTWRKQTNPNPVWGKRYHPEFPLAMSFLDASVNARDAQIAGDEALRRREIRRTRFTALIFAVAFIFSLGMGVYAYGKKNSAQRSQLLAEGQARIAEGARKETADLLKRADGQNQLIQLANRHLKDSQDEIDKRSKEALAQRDRAEAQTLLAKKSAENASKQQSLAEQQKTLATSRELAATSSSQLFSDTQASLASAIKAEETANTGEAEFALQQALLEPHLQAVIDHYPGEATSGVMSSDEKYVLTVTGGEEEDQTQVVQVSEVSSGRVLDKMSLSTLLAASFSHNGKTILVSGEYEGLLLWTWGGQSHPVKIPVKLESDNRVYGEFVEGVTFLFDGKLVVRTTRKAQVWEAEEGRAPKLLLSLDGWVINPGSHNGRHDGSTEKYFAPFVSPDGRYIIAASESQTAKAVGQPSHVWEVSTRRRLPDLQDGGYIVSPQFSADAKFMLGVSDDGKQHLTMRLWDLSTGRHFAGVESNSGDSPLALSPDGKRFVTTRHDGSSPQLWKVPEADAGKDAVIKPLTLGGHLFPVTSAAFSPDGKFVLTGSEDTTARLWDAETGNLVSVLRGHKDAVRSVAFSEDGNFMLTKGDQQEARLWAASMAQGLNERVSAPKMTQARFNADKNMTGSDGPQQRAKIYSPNGNKYELTIKDDFTLEVSETATGRSLASSRFHTAAINSAAFSPDGKSIATASDDFTAQVWEWDGDQKPVRLEHGRRVLQVFFGPVSADGQQVATTCDADGAPARLWQLPRKGGTRVLEMDNSKELNKVSDYNAFQARSMAFSPDAQLLVTASSDDSPKDSVARIWDLKTHMIAHPPLRGHTAPVVSVAFSPDGKFILTGSEDGTARLWEAKTGRFVTGLYGNKSYVKRVGFSDDGKSIIVVSDVTRLYSCPVCGPPEDLLKHAKERFTWELKEATPK